MKMIRAARRLGSLIGATSPGYASSSMDLGLRGHVVRAAARERAGALDA
ncbi:MAG: hypothetical protein U0263_22915 [Polyangiaceae bacterium]